jgi:hypothetical protein
MARYRILDIAWFLDDSISFFYVDSFNQLTKFYYDKVSGKEHIVSSSLSYSEDPERGMPPDPWREIRSGELIILPDLKTHRFNLYFHGTYLEPKLRKKSWILNLFVRTVVIVI